VNNVDKKIYKDVRKINVGVCDKDVKSMRSKKKSAFYNCFVLIIRVRCPIASTTGQDVFKEAHVKVFNTGKLELPGIKDPHSHIYILNLLIKLFQKHCNMDKLSFKNEHETVLINSNFTCGYCLDREKFAHILQKKYNIETTYDPCSYPGIMSKIPLDTSGLKVSFMVFRTGSVLIVGKCSEEEIHRLYADLCQKFRDEYDAIHIENHNEPNCSQPRGKTKNVTRKKYISIG
jgi:TATA-box binding protein (TBP) (component of TFIID and TFIIIB)